MQKIKYLKIIFPSLVSHSAVQICSVSHIEYFVKFQEITFDGALHSKEIEILHNVSSFSKLCYGYFSANITKFSEQLSLTPFLNYIVNEYMSN